MIDMKGPEGKVRLRFFHKAWSSYRDKDENITETLRTEYWADNWKQACQDAADCWDWDDGEVINFDDAESDLIETGRDLESIEYQNADGGWTPVPKEVSDYFEKVENEAMDAD